RRSPALRSPLRMRPRRASAISWAESFLLPFTATFSWVTTKRYNFDPSLGSYPEVVYGYLPSGDNLHRVGSQLGRVGEHLRHRGSPCMFSLSSPPSSSSPSSSSCSGSTAPPASSACCCSPSASRPTARPSVPPGRSCSPYWWRGPPCEAPRPPSGGPRARTATAPLRPCGRRQL